MNPSSPLPLLLAKPQNNGIYQLATPLLPTIAQASALAQLAFHRIDLTQIRSKTDLLSTLAVRLNFDQSFGHNFDALADALSDALAEIAPAASKGHVLLLVHSAHLPSALGADFGILLDVLRAVAEESQQRKQPFYGLFDSPAYPQHALPLLVL